MANGVKAQVQIVLDYLAGGRGRRGGGEAP